MFKFDHEPIVRRIKEIVLDRFDIAKRVHCPFIELTKPQLGVYLRNDLDEAVIDICVFIAGKSQRSEVCFYTPLTWRDMFKEKHRDKWWMRRWIKKHPIKRKTHKYNLIKYTTFPNLDIPFDFSKKTHIIYRYFDVEKV